MLRSCNCLLDYRSPDLVASCFCPVFDHHSPLNTPSVCALTHLLCPLVQPTCRHTSDLLLFLSPCPPVSPITLPARPPIFARLFARIPHQVRRLRTLLRSGALSRVDYERLVDQQVAFAIGVQEALGLDVLVHGEPEVGTKEGGDGVCVCSFC